MIKYLEKTPTAEEYNNLTDKVGWGKRKESIVKEALVNSLYSICVYDDESLIGYGRIIGDKTIFLYVQDIMVSPEYQNQKIGSSIMKKIIEKVDEYKKENNEIRTYLGASKGKEDFYKKFGFITRKEADLRRRYDPSIKYYKKGDKKMDIWEEMYEKAKKEYHPENVSPFIIAHHVCAAVQSESGKIFTGFCIEGASGVMDLCAERVAALNMYLNTGETKIIRMIAFRSEPPKKNGGMPCGACREFFMQLNYDNRDMEILTDYDTRKVVYLKDLIPNWWGDKRYNK